MGARTDARTHNRTSDSLVKMLFMFNFKYVNINNTCVFVYTITAHTKVQFTENMNRRFHLF